jgi:hypothetical protein
MTKISRQILLFIPAVIFILLLAVLILKSPNPEPNSTEVITTPGPVTQISPTPKSETELQILINQIRSYSPKDPNLAMPNFDREIEL